MHLPLHVTTQQASRRMEVYILVCVRLCVPVMLAMSLSTLHHQGSTIPVLLDHTHDHSLAVCVMTHQRHHNITGHDCGL